MKNKKPISSPKTMKTSKRFNKIVLLETKIPRNKEWYKKRDECKKVGGVFRSGKCSKKLKFKAGKPVKDPISKR
jgi:hypothetical protein